MIDVPVVDTTD